MWLRKTNASTSGPSTDVILRDPYFMMLDFRVCQRRMVRFELVACTETFDIS